MNRPGLDIDAIVREVADRLSALLAPQAADMSHASQTRIGQTPHLTLHGLKDELAARGVKVSHNAVWMFLRREGFRFKKNAARA